MKKHVDHMPYVAVNLRYFDYLVDYAYPSQPTQFKSCLRQSVLDGTWVNLGGLLEKAISVSGCITRRSIVGMDFTDHTDAKMATARFRSKGQSYSAGISGTHRKVGHLRALCLEPMTGQFHHFLIPNSAYSHMTRSSIEIPFHTDGLPKRKNTCAVNWWDFECESFEHLCARTDTPQTTHAADPQPSHSDAGAMCL